MADLLVPRHPLERNGGGALSTGLRALDDLPFSAQPWVAERCRRRAADALASVSERLGGYGVRVVFLAGSAALGEAVGWEDEPRIVLSDLDLGVVTREAVPAGTRAALEAELAALDVDGLGPSVGLGIYDSVALPRQVGTPGAVDFLQQPCPLAGEARVLGRFPAMSPGTLRPWEGFRLVGNRGVELLLAPEEDDPRARAVALYRFAKLAEGIGKAWLVGRGLYQVGREARAERLAAADVPAEVSAAALAWRGFLARPSGGSAALPDLAALRRGLVALFREHGYWAAGGPGPVAAYLHDPRTIRDRLREWRGHLGRAGGWTWALLQGFRGTPEVRRLGVGALYWLALPERPEPRWERERRDPDDPVPPEDAERIWAGTRVLLGRELPFGAGARRETLRVLGGDAEGAGGSGQGPRVPTEERSRAE